MEGLPPAESLLFPERWARELEQHLPQYLPRQRWFGGKAKTIRHVRLVDFLRLRAPLNASAQTGDRVNATAHASKSQMPGENAEPEGSGRRPHTSASQTESVFWLLIVSVHYTEGDSEFYTLPVALALSDSAIPEGSVIVRWPQADKEVVVAEVSRCPEFWLALAALMMRWTHDTDEGSPAQTASWSVVHTQAFSLAQLASFEPGDLAIFAGEQSQNLAVLGQSVVVKLFRHFEAGISPDWEISRFLTEQQHFAYIPPALAALEYRLLRSGWSEQGGAVSSVQGTHCEATTLAMMTGYRPNRGDAWKCLLEELATACDVVLAGNNLPDGSDSELPALPDGYDGVFFLLTAAMSEPQQLTQATGMLTQPILFRGRYTARMNLLGQRTAQLHLALANSRDPAFAPEPIDMTWQQTVAESCVRQIKHALDLLRRRLADLNPATVMLADQVLQQEERLQTRAWAISQRPVEGQRIRIHGDYHLGQVLCTDEDFVLLDFEGEPTRPLAERRSKQSPLRDVAGMIRSFHYAVASTWRTRISGLSPTQRKKIRRWLEQWYLWTAVTFLRGYLKTPHITSLLPARMPEVHLLLSVFLLEKAAYELAYELNHRPDWVDIPLQGLLSLAGEKFTALSSDPSISGN
jgi:maltose alpha-D-glucosyltransferase/alpha-amylase